MRLKYMPIGGHEWTKMYAYVNFCTISESGIINKEDIVKLKRYGFNGFLIGENFMKTNDPSNACLNFIKSLHE